jgi:hypothetical protein
MANKDYKFDITAQNRTDKAFAKVNQSLDKTSKGMGAMKRHIVGAFSVAILTNFGRNALQTADDLAKVSSSIGVNVEFLQRYQFAAEQSGVSAEGFDKSLRFFAKTMGEATMGLGLGLDAVQQLNVSLRDAQGETKSIDDLFIEMMGLLEGVTNATEKAGLATKLFGRAGIPMVNMIRDGSDAMHELAAIAPGVLTEEDTKRAEEFNDAMNVLTRTLKGPAQSAFIGIVNYGKEVVDLFGRMRDPNVKDFYTLLYGDRTEGEGRKKDLEEDFNETTTVIDKRMLAFADRINQGLLTPTQKIQAFKEELEEAVKVGIFNASDMDAAIAKFKEQFEKGIKGSIDVVQNFKDTVEGDLTGAFQDFFDHTSQGFLKMKDLIGSVVDSIIAEIIRLAVIKPIVDYIVGGPIAAIASIFGKQSGGPVTGGKTYLVGERGPELFTAPGNGNIVPNGAMAGGGSTNINITYDIKAFDAQSATAAIAEQAPTIVGIVEQSFRQRGRRGPLGA